jgi:hypothetical protein
VGIQAEADEVAGAQRHVGVEQELLRHVADPREAPTRPFVPCAPDPRSALGAAEEDPPGARRLQAQDHPQERGLTGPVGADQPGELAGPDVEMDVAEHLAPAELHADPLHGEDRVAALGLLAGRGICSRSVALAPGHQSLWVETRRATASRSARTSASIQDW